jgi:hypothetical protein
MFRKTQKFLLTLAVIFVTSYAAVFAAVPAPIKNLDDVKSKILCGVASWLFAAAIVVSIIYVLIAAFKYMGGSDSSEKITEAHKSLVYAAIGIAVAIVAGGMPYIVGSFFEVDAQIGQSACSSARQTSGPAEEPCLPGHMCF